MGSNAPAPQNYAASAAQQAQASQSAVDRQTGQNRIAQNNGNATTTYGPNGQQTTLNGPLGGLQTSLQQQAADAMGQPLDLSGLPPILDGAQAREQAISSAYGESSKRLDSRFGQQKAALEAQLAGQGVVPGSEAYNQALSNFENSRNDAYGSAMNGAVSQGTAAGQALQQQSLMQRQSMLGEILRKRGQAFSELGGLQGLTQQQGYNQAGRAETPQYLQAAGMQSADDWRNYQWEQQQIRDAIEAGGQLGATALGMPGGMFKL